ncbi:MAG: hypothetical protein P1U57_06010 [Oleibacter sp.]|nr:hypothetical protein [Thalassolituus sp.]
MAAFFEIVELSNGDVALRRADEDEGDALMRIHFSEDAKATLQEHHMDVARVMLEAGVRLVGELSGMEVEHDDFDLSSASARKHLH